MQGVFIKRIVVGHKELTNLVTNNEGRVFFQNKEQFVKVLTKQQNQKFNKKMAQLAMLNLAPSSVPILLLEKLNGEVTGIAGIEWYSCYIRPKSKKELQLAVQDDPENIHLEVTSIFGNEYSGQLSKAPLISYPVVGPDPSENRSWFGEILWSDRKNMWIVK